MMKSLTFVAGFILFLGIVGCVETEEELITKTCNFGFDFSSPARDWIALLPGPDYVFKSGEKVLKVNSEYDISEPNTIKSTPESLERDLRMSCFGQYIANHQTEDRSVRIYNSVAQVSNQKWVNMLLTFQYLSFELDLINDTLTARRWNPTEEKPDNHLFENIPNLKIGEKEYPNVFKITQLDSSEQIKEIYLAKRQGLVAFTRSDSLWVVEW